MQGAWLAWAWVITTWSRSNPLVYDDIKIRQTSIKRNKTSYLSVGFKITDEVQEDTSSLCGESAFVARSFVLLAYSVTSNATSVFCEGDGSLLNQYITQVRSSLGKTHSLNCTGDFTAVLVVNANVGSAGLYGLGGIVNVSAINQQITLA